MKAVSTSTSDGLTSILRPAIVHFSSLNHSGLPSVAFLSPLQVAHRHESSKLMSSPLAFKSATPSRNFCIHLRRLSKSFG